VFVVAASLRQLVELGFFVKRKGRVARSKTEHDRNVYQRPSVAHTLLTLLKAGSIDGTFNPSPKAARRARRGSASLRGRRQIEKPMLQALDVLLGSKDRAAYLHAPDTEKAQFLIKALDVHSTKKRELAIAAAAVAV